MADRLVAVATFGEVALSHAARGLLANEGIDAFVDGDDTAGEMWNRITRGGTVRLLVREADQPRAVAILEAVRERDMRAPATILQIRSPWTCPTCGEKLDADFEVCWSCGTLQSGERDPTFADHRSGADDIDSLDRDDAADAFDRVRRKRATHDEDTDNDTGAEGDSDENEHSPHVLSLSGHRREVDQNPYVAPRTVGERALSPGDDLPPEIADELNATATRAWRAAVVAMLMPAVGILLTLYSIWILLELSFGEHPLPRFAKRRVRWAIAANAVAVVVGGLVGGPLISILFSTEL